MDMKRISVILVLFLCFTSLGFGAGKELFREAEGRYKSGNYTAALDLYTRFIDENRIAPDVPDAQFKRAVCMYQLGRNSEALDLFARIRQVYASTSYIDMVPFWQGRILLEQGSYEKAAAFFDEYIRRDSPSLINDAFLYRAMSYEQLGRSADAAYSLELLLARDDFSDDGYIAALLGSIYLKLGEMNNLIALAESSVRESVKPEYRSRLQLYEAEAKYRSGDLTGAEKIFAALTGRQDVETGIVWQRLFTIYRSLGRDDYLAVLLEKAEHDLRSNPEILRDFRMRIGIASYNNGDPVTAEKYFLNIWDTSAPSEMNGLVPLYYSRILEENGRRERAVEILEIFSAESVDRRAEILVRLAELYTFSDSLGKAETRLDEFFSSFTESSFFYEAAYLKAFISYKHGRVDEALDYAGRAWSADSNGERAASLLRLEASLLKKKEDYKGASDKLIRYLNYKPDDVYANLDLLRLRFLLKDYKSLLEDAVDFKWREDVRERYQDAYLLSAYMSGLAAIALSDYDRAVSELSLISPVNTASSGLESIYPFALFYRGWAMYRKADYAPAMKSFDELVKDYSDSESAAEASYLAGWCGYLLGDYEASSSYFLKYSGLSGNDDRGRFMYAKNLTALERYREASNIFAEISRKADASPLADDALFEKAALSALMGDAVQAAADYEYLFKKYGGDLAEESMFRRGEILYSAEKYEAAAAAYYDFRRYFPASPMFDAALYWGGMALKANGEGFGAALLWEKIISDYGNSGFRAPAMLKAAGVYADADDFSSALAMYERCRLEYPGTEMAAAAADESEKLRLLLDGLSPKEAELNVIITREGGAASPAGRRAMIELSALYISMGGSDLKPAVSMLTQVAEYANEDPEAAADAQFYIGEYYYRQNNFKEAVKAFIKTAGINPSNRDSSARALYRAADTAILAGSRSDAEELVARLKQHYAGSVWAIEAEKLLGGAKR